MYQQQAISKQSAETTYLNVFWAFSINFITWKKKMSITTQSNSNTTQEVTLHGGMCQTHHHKTPPRTPSNGLLDARKQNHSRSAASWAQCQALSWPVTVMSGSRGTWATMVCFKQPESGCVIQVYCGLQPFVILLFQPHTSHPAWL